MDFIKHQWLASGNQTWVEQFHAELEGNDLGYDLTKAAFLQAAKSRSHLIIRRKSHETGTWAWMERDVHGGKSELAQCSSHYIFTSPLINSMIVANLWYPASLDRLHYIPPKKGHAPPQKKSVEACPASHSGNSGSSAWKCRVWPLKFNLKTSGKNSEKRGLKDCNVWLHLFGGVVVDLFLSSCY